MIHEKKKERSSAELSEAVWDLQDNKCSLTVHSSIIVVIFSGLLHESK